MEKGASERRLLRSLFDSAADVALTEVVPALEDGSSEKLAWIFCVLERVLRAPALFRVTPVGGIGKRRVLSASSRRRTRRAREGSGRVLCRLPPGSLPYGAAHLP